eukprot:scaffold52472_cov69-Phaeocystis_antarctica.AAC.6
MYHESVAWQGIPRERLRRRSDKEACDKFMHANRTFEGLNSRLAGALVVDVCDGSIAVRH